MIRFILRPLKLLVPVFLWAILLSACDPYEKAYKERADKAASQEGKITLGVVDSSLAPSLFVEGVRLAVEDLNESGGVLGKKIRTVVYDDEGRTKKGEKIAKKLAVNTDIIAVIGHRFSNVAIPASVTYEECGTLFISPGATDQDLIRDGNQFTFRNIPSDEVMGREAALFADRNGYNRIVIIFDSESSGKRISEIFHEHIDALNKQRAKDDKARKITIVAEKSYAGWQQDFRPLISDIIKAGEFDAVFLGGVLPSAARMIKQLRDMGVTVPILGSDLLDSSELWNIAGKQAEGTIVSTVFDPKQPKAQARNFVKKFKKDFGLEPDTWAAQGYDAVRVLAHAMEQSGSTEPIVVATTLRLLRNWEGATGSYSFEEHGNITGKSVFFKEIRGGHFRFLEAHLRQDINPYEVIEDMTLRLPVEGIITTIDPGLTKDMTSIEITEQLFLGLTDFNAKTYVPEPELAAEQWTVSKDGRIYRFRLRKDAIWTDGTPVTAHDLVWAVQRNIRPETRCPNAGMLYILRNARAIHKGEITDVSQIGVRAIDDFTVEFELEHPAAYFPGMAGLWVFRPLPRKVIEKYGAQWTDPKHIQTNGSYRLALWEKGMVMILRKNHKYFDADKVAIEEVRYNVIPESSVGLAMYKNDQIDIMGDSYLRLPLPEIPRIKNLPVLSAEYHQEPAFCTYAFGFNTRRPPTDNPLVRRAISAAIDRNVLIQVVAGGNYEPATTFTRPPVFGAVDPAEGVGISFNPLQAKQWLAEAGYPDGQGFPEISLLYNESETHENIAQAVRTLLKHYLNIEVKPDPRKWEEYLALRQQPTTPHIFRIGWCADYPDANNWLNEGFHPTNSPNMIGWDNEEFAKLMEQGEKEKNPENRVRIYRRAEQILCEEMCAVVPIYFETANYLVKSRVKGWYNMALGGQHIRDWYLEEVR